MSDRPATQPQPAGSVHLSLRIDAALKRGAFVLTPNLRTARRLAAQFDDARRAEGLLAWQPANVLTWSAWTTSLWQSALIAGSETRVLLNDLQERAVWQRVLQQDATQSLRPLVSQARLCSGALRLLGAFDTANRFGRITTQDVFSDTATFANWYARFTDLCAAEGLLPTSHLDTEIAGLLRDGRMTAADEYILYGFDRLTPAQRVVTDALQQAGSLLQHVAPSRNQAASPRLLACGSPDDELQACSAWAREALADGERVAILVPDLETTRPELERALRSAAAPALADVTASVRPAPYEFSTGRPLSQVAMVADALRLLRWCAGSIPVPDAGAVLCSPNLSVAPSPERGAELDAFVLRDASADLLRAEVSLAEAASILFKRDADTAGALRGIASAARPLDSTRNSHAYFADESRKLLQRAGWPGVQELSSTEYQAIDRWEEALDRLSTLDLLGGRTTFANFLDDLTDLARETLFAPENTGAPIQVMSITEAAGNTADALWFLHADDATWPPRRAMHPLLPSALQRSLGMPGSEADRDEDEAREAMMRCVRSASRTTFSYASSAAEGHRRSSPLVEAMPGIVFEFATVDEAAEAPAQIESVEDTMPLPPLPAGVAAGGVSVLTAQAQCGFRAFAEGRLFVRELETIDAGLSPRDRGEQVHTALQAFWDTVKTQAELIRISRKDATGDRKRDALLQSCIEKAFEKTPANQWDAAYLQVQRERLFKLLSSWLDVEAQRPPFTVLHTELKVPGAQVGPLRVDMRVDRIDRVGSEEEGTGATVLIDYKTGVAERKDWIGDRLEAPQLPVYAIAGGIDDVRGIAFGSVRVQKDGMKFDEMAERAGMIGPATRTKRDLSFDERMEEWRRDLQRLAEAYANGEAAVDPKDHLITCKHCASRPICRLDLTQLEPDDDLTEEEDEAPAW
ncbi:putative DNA repair protein [Terriglobus roseus DSM 18391]|uniref:Putative DNA repair protein n=1 Tax=Terriglobus roseus (strain DSM 18391 / NRRL B-41598 / KBS 63) TaxID=926566 RepID=I3ZEK8_TERRK|nr:PD-(D/E)XK nuclease family protein [Terriglobus roseus]AFL87676.1 putative DNA repair protein [Terriglobus roseus DSM 18391]